MECLGKIDQLLEEKKQLFLQYESLTACMLDAQTDALVLAVQKRQSLCEQIDQIDRQIRKQAQQLEDGQQLWEALFLRCQRSQLPAAYQPLFDRAQEFFAIANRVRRMEPRVLLHMQRQKDEIMGHIKENNQSVGARAAKFGAGLPAGQSVGLLGEKYSKV